MGSTRGSTNQTAGKGGLISENYFQSFLNHYPQLFNVKLAKMKNLKTKILILLHILRTGPK